MVLNSALHLKNLKYCLSVMIQNKTLQTITNKTNQSSESSKSILSLNFSLIPHLHCWHQAFYILYCKQPQKCLTDFIYICHDWWHTLELRNLTRNWFKTPQNKGNMCQGFGGKAPCHMRIIRIGFGFQSRRFSKLSHSSTPSHCAATVAFCLHQYMSPNGACGVEASSRQAAPEATKGLSPINHKGYY